MSTSNDRSDIDAIRDQIVADAMGLDPTFFADGSDYTLPGRFERAEDGILANALDIIVGHGHADDQCGTVDYIGHAARVGPFIMRTDTQGFITVEEREGEGDAVSRMEQLAGELDDPDRPMSWAEVAAIPFNGSNDPVYQETMRVAKVMVEDALNILRRALDHLDGADETEPEHDALNGAIEKLAEVGADKFDIEPPERR